MSFGVSFVGLKIISCLFWFALVVWAWKEKKMSLWLVVIGGAANLFERFYFGFVTDYWKIPGVSLYNNANDWLIFLGFTWYIWQKWKTKK